MSLLFEYITVALSFNFNSLPLLLECEKKAQKTSQVTFNTSAA